MFMLLLIIADEAKAQTYTLNAALNNTTQTTCSGNFFDSGGSGGNYQSFQNYNVTFCANDPDEKLRLTFTSFTTEENYDFLYIYDGINISSPLMGTYSGSSSPGIVTSQGGNCLTVKFTSDISFNFSGWQASVSCVAPTSASGEYLLTNTNNGTTNTVCSGKFIDSGGSASNYSNSQDRTITFCTTVPTERMRFAFSSFNIESGYDFMYIFDGASTASSLIGTFTGTNSPGTVTSVNSNCLTVRFTSDNIVTRPGWTADLSCVPPAATNSCGLTIKNVNVSGCYVNSGVSKATVSVEVAWTTAPLGQQINVTLGSQTKSFTPGNISVNYGALAVGIGSQTILSPQVIAFEVNADGSNGNVNAVFSGTPSCNSSKSYSLPNSCISACSSGQLGGTVFNDYDRDGIKDGNETSTVANITIKAISKAGNIFTTKTDAVGKYSLAIPSAEYPVRIEFSDIPSGYGQGTMNGTDGRTTTQFINGPECGADLGILASDGSCAGNTKIFVPCYVNGDPLVAGAPANMDAFVGFNYGTTGIGNSTTIQHYATASQVGSLWGVAYNRKTDRIFTTATLKRHVGLGPQGLGGIYVINPNITTGPVTSWNLASIGINVGTVGNNSSRGLLGNLLSPSRDTAAWYGAGRRGIGDIEISEDGNTLWLVNLYDKKLYKLDITAYNLSGTAPTSADWVSYTIPDPGCTGGSFRPWGLKVYQGKVYVGAICDGFTSQSKSDMRAYVFEYDPAVNTWYNRFDFPLTYPKGFALGITTAQMARTGWYPWTDNFNTKIIDSWVVYPEPILSDIEFDIDGSLTLGFLDRTSFQTGYQNYGLTGSNLYDNSAGGDILKAYYNNGSFILENNAKAGAITGSGANNQQGPGFGEFYNDNWVFGSLYHAENGLGGLTVKPGSGEVVSVNIDPTNDVPWSGGVRYYNNGTGVANSSFVIYQTQVAGGAGTQGKAAGLGDLEISCLAPIDLEIGNRVWMDRNKDGVQDPDELPISGVKVRLYKGSTLIAETTTNANGEYYFKDNSVAGVTWSGVGADIRVLPETDYTIVFGKSTVDQFSGNNLTVGGQQYLITNENSTLGTGNDINDSDAIVSDFNGTNYPLIEFTTGALGSINHTLDMGVFICQTVTNPSAPQSVCFGAMGANITVNTNLNDSNSIEFVLFTTQQTGQDMYFNGGTSLGTFTPTGSSAPFLATYTWNNADFPGPGTYYIYAILDTESGPLCRPSQEIVITLTAPPSLINFVVTQATCGGSMIQNNGYITLTSISNATHFGVSTINASSYDGPSFASAIPIVGQPEVQSNIPNIGGSFIIRLFNGTNDCFVDDTIIVPPVNCYVSVGSNVFADNNNNGIDDGVSEQGIQNVRVEVFSTGVDGIKGNSDDGPFVGFSITDANGNWYVDSMLAGEYYAKISTPSSAFPTSSSPSVTDVNDNAEDNDDNGIQMGGAGTMVMSPEFILAADSELSGETGSGGDQDNTDDNNGDMTIDFGFVPYVSVGSNVFVDNNNNGIDDGASDQGISNVRVDVYSVGADGVKGGTDDVIAGFSITDGSGNWYVDSLLPGIYFAKVNTPDPLFPVSSPTDNAGDVDGIDSNDNGVQMGGAGGMVMTAAFTLAGDSEVLDAVESGSGGTQDNTDDNNGDMTIDFGFVPYVSVGSNVFVDNNNNGIDDGASDQGISNVRVDVYSVGADGVKGGTDDVIAGFSITDGSGNWYVDSLLPGIYFAKVNTPDPLFPVSSPTDNAGGVDGIDSNDNGVQMGGAGGMVMTAAFTLTGEGEVLDAVESGSGGTQDNTDDNNGDMTIDFGFVPYVSVGSNVFVDNNNNGIDDGASDQGISNVRVDVYSVGSDGVKGGTDDVIAGFSITDGSGNWYVDSLLPGIYFAKVNTPDPLFPVSSPTDNAGGVDGIDSNDNGVQMGGAGGMVMTAAFTLAGDSEVLDAVESGSGGTQDNADDNNGDMTIDFGFVPYVSVGSNVFADNNNNGIDDGASDQGISNVRVDVYSVGADGVKGGTDDVIAGFSITDGSGNWYVDSLLPGIYFAKVNTPDPLFPVSSPTDNAGGEDGIDSNDNGVQMGGAGGMVMTAAFTLAGDSEVLDAVESGSGGTQDNADDNNGDMTIDFGFVPYVSVGSNVFADNNNNGIDDGASDQGISNVRVDVYSVGADGVKGGTDDVIAGFSITDGSGNWYVDSLLPGIYFAKVNTPDPLFPVSSPTDNAGGEDGIDSNDNGVQMGGAGGMVMTAAFTLAGDSEVLDAVESGSGGTQDNADDNNGDMTIDFGFVPYVSVGSNVFVDNNNNGIDDGASDQGISNVRVDVYSVGADGVKGGTDDVIAGFSITDGSGNWYVDSLLPGIYFAKVNTPDPLFPVSSPTDNAGGVDGIDSNDNGVQMGGAGGMVMTAAFTLTGEGEVLDAVESGSGGTQDNTDDNNGDMTIDFGFVPYVSVGSNVFVDNNNNGIDDGASDQGISNVRVDVYSVGADGVKGGTDDVIAGFSITDGSGNWYVDSLLPGIYFAKVNTPDPLFPVSSPTDNAGGVDGIDSNDNGVQMGGAGGMVMTAAFTLTGEGEVLDAVESGSGGTQDNTDDNNGDMTIDFGFVPYVSVGSNVFVDNNNNGIDDGASDQGISNVRVDVYSVGADGVKGGTDDVIAGFSITDGSGNWYVDSLLPGIYFAKVNTPDPLFPVSSPTDNAGGVDGIDSNDNGVQMGGAGGMVMTAAFTLTGDSEVLDAVESGSGGTQDNTDDNNGDMTIDFGFVPYVSVGSNVFADNNNNGIDDGASDQGISNVRVDVYSVGADGVKGGTDDVIAGFSITDGSGNWYVDSLLPGIYFAKVNTPDPLFPVSSPTDNAGGVDGIDSNDNGVQMGGAGGMVMTAAFTLTGDSEVLDAVESGSGGTQDNTDDNNGDMTIDFGFVSYVSVGSNVFADNNNNGIDDGASDQGISNVRVDVYSVGADGVKGGTDDVIAGFSITDGSGNWYVDSLLPGIYFAKVNTPDPLFPVSSPTDNAGGVDGIDSNDNGVQMGGAGGMVMTAAFTLAGDSEVLDAVESGSGGTQDNADDNNGDMTIDFGFVPYVSVGSNVFVDNNNNGIDDGASDQGISNVRVDVYSVGADGVKGSTDDVIAGFSITDGSGNWYVDSLLPGIYFAKVNTPDPLFPVSSPTDNAGGVDGIDSNDNGVQMGGAGGMVMTAAFTLTGEGEVLDAVESGSGGTQDNTDDNNGDMTIDFGFVPYVSVGSNVFVDNNNNGIDDGASDQGISNVRVDVYSVGADGVKGGTDDVIAGFSITDGSGNWYVDSLLPGIYFAKVNTPDPLFPVSSPTDNAGGVDGIDSNDNGVQMGGAGGMVMTAAFTLTGDGEVLDAVESGSGGTQDNNDDNNGDMTIDFGFVPYVSVGSNVFADNNNNGIDDGASDQGISNVRVDVYSVGADGVKGGTDDVIAGFSITDGSGNWYVDSLLPGIYFAKVNTPDPLFPVSSPTDNAGGEDGIDSNDNGVQMGGAGGMVMTAAFTLAGDSEVLDAVESGSGGTQDNTDDNNGDMTIDFGFVPYVSVGSNVFVDNNNNGIDDGASDQGISNVRVDVYSVGADGVKGGTDDVIAGFSITDGSGNWYVDSLLPGIYFAKVNTPDPLFPVSSPTDNAGGVDGIDSNDNGVQMGGAGGMVMTAAFTLAGDSEVLDAVESGSGGTQDNTDDNNGDMTIDFGFVPYVSVGSNVFVDNNNNGIDDGASDQGISNVRVDVYSVGSDGVKGGTDDVIAGFSITDGSGNWYVDSLLPGIYFAKVNTPDPLFPVSSPTDNAGGVDGIDSNDNGVQMGGAGGMVMTAAFTLTGEGEVLDAVESGSGGTQDNTDDNNGDMTIDFGFVPYVSVGSNVFVDNNNNGIDDGASDQGISNVRVDVYSVGADGVKGGTDDVIAGFSITDGSGNWYVDSLLPGIYFAKVNTPDPLFPVSSPTDNAGGEDGIDSNDNGVQMGGAGGMVMTAAFTLTGDSEVLDAVESGSGGTQDNTDDNNGDMTIDFGFVPYVSVGSNVFADNNNNGLDDGNTEEGISNIRIDIYSVGGDGVKGGIDDVITGFAITDGNGNWYVDSLIPGVYYASINTPSADYPVSSTTDNAGGMDGIDNNDNGVQMGGAGGMVMTAAFTLTGDSEVLDAVESGSGGTQDNTDDNNGDMTIDFGFVPYYSIGNQVWVDFISGSGATNYDGVKNGTELGLNGVMVQLYTTAGALVQTTKTVTIGANQGMYLFDSLLPGDYIVVIPGSQSMPGGPLQNFLSSSGTFNTGGPYEVAAGIDPDNNVDNVDDGTFNTNPLYSFAVVSNPISIGEALSESLVENPDNDFITKDKNENLTVDFGFIPKVFDLALTKKTMAIQPIDSFNFKIEFMTTIYNQGNMDATNIEITDYMPDGFAYHAMSDTVGVASGFGSGWSLIGSNAKYTITDTVSANTFVTVAFFVTVQMAQMQNGFVNFAEISSAADTLGNTPSGGPYGALVDIDSHPDSNSGNDAGGKPNRPGDPSPADNYVLGDGTGVVGDGVAATDEDDHDPSFVEVIDAALIKKLADGQAPFKYGDTVTFTIDVINQGSIDLYNIEVSDYIPSGLTYLNSNNGTWSLNGNTAKSTITGPLAMLDTVRLTIAFRIEHMIPSTNKDAWTNVAEVSKIYDVHNTDISLDDIDSTPDNVNGNDPGGEPQSPDDDNTSGIGNIGQDEDDHDPTLVPIFDLALTKQLLYPDSIYMFGQVIDFIIPITNQGNQDAYNIIINEYVPGALTEVGAGANLGWTFSGANGTYVYSGPLSPGQSDTILLSMTFQAASSYIDYINYAEVSDFSDELEGGSEASTGALVDADSTPDTIKNNDDGGSPSLPGNPSPNDDYIDGNGRLPGGTPGDATAITDEDDHDPVLLGFVDMALEKTLVSPTNPIKVGDDVEFAIKLMNQGTFAMKNIKVSDYIPAGFQLSPVGNGFWTSINAGLATAVVSGPLAFGEDTTIKITLRVLPNANVDNLVNNAELSQFFFEFGGDATSLDIDSDSDTIKYNDKGGGIYTEADDEVDGDGSGTVGDGVADTDEDDHDPAVPYVVDLALVKTSMYVAPVIPGDDVTFHIKIYNQGNVPVTNLKVKDFIPFGYTLSLNDTNGWMAIGTTMAEKTITDTIFRDSSLVMNIVLTVGTEAFKGNHINYAEIIEAKDTLGIDIAGFDLDSKPDDEDGSTEGNIGTPNDDKTDGSTNLGQDSDDSDPAPAPVMDLAIRKLNTVIGSSDRGDNVKFTIEVFNQGTIPVQDVVISDYIPSGLELASVSENAIWTLVDTVATTTLTEVLLPDSSILISIWLKVKANAIPTNVVNMAEISEVLDTLGNDISARDIDSYADDINDDKGNDLYSDFDNITDQSGRNGEDEDDHDQAFVLLCNGMACIGSMNVSVDENCEVALAASILLTGDDLFPDKLYSITVKDSHGNIRPDNHFTKDDIGKQFEVKICLPICDNNCCWNTVTIEDKFRPSVVCTNDTISCVAPINEVTRPQIIDNCGGSTLILLNEVVTPLTCDTLFLSRITRTWTAIDEYGNMADTCTQDIYIKRTRLSGIAWPRPITISCKSFTTAYPPISMTGVPTFEGHPLHPLNQTVICNGFSVFNDIDYINADCKRIIQRTWEVGEWWCNSTNIQTWVQLIEVKDDEGPVIGDLTPMSVSTNTGSCKALVNLPAAKVTDNCNTYSVHVSTGEGVLNSNGGLAELSVGAHTVTYTATDLCGNQSTKTMRVLVTDLIEPIALCHTKVVVSLKEDGTAWLYDTSVDNGSFDECGDVDLKIRRMTSTCDTMSTAWVDAVGICCADVGKEVMVGLLVTDEGGNTNQCMVTVEVQDKRIATITCPLNVTVSCTTGYDDQDLGATFGEAEIGGGGCSSNASITELLTGELNSCRLGILERSFTLRQNGIVVGGCKQTVTFIAERPFNENMIVYPRDTTFVNGRCNPLDLSPESLPLKYGKPQLEGEGVCDLVASSYTDDVYSFNGNGACYKIVRHWTVINWCYRESGKIWQDSFDQVLVVMNNTKPTITSNTLKREVCSYNVDCTPVAIKLDASATDDCTPTSELKWRWEITLANGVKRNGTGRDASGTYAFGLHHIDWEVEDKCGNISYTSYDFEVKSCKAPTAYCKQGLSTELVGMDTDNNGTLDTEMSILKPSFFDNGSSHTCGNTIKLSFSANVNDTILSVSCPQKNKNVPVQLWVTDHNGNTAYCTTFVNVQDNNNVDICPATSPTEGQINGKVLMADGRGVKGVAIELISTDERNTLTDGEGKYAFADVPLEMNYNVKPKKSDDVMNGVSTLDLVMIQRHILGAQKLTDPYKILAADVNKDGKITASDLVQLRKLILGSETKMVDDESWRFLAEGQTFADPGNPMTSQLVHTYDISKLEGDMTINFTGYKVGDVNGNVVANTNDTGTEPRSNKSLDLYFEDKHIHAGEQYSVPINVNEAYKVQGLQTSFRASGLKIVGLTGEDISLDNIHQITDDMYNMSIHQKDGKMFSANTALMVMKVEAIESGRLSNMLSLSGEMLTSEAYLGNHADIASLTLKSIMKNVDDVFAVSQNVPNPWQYSTKVKIAIPQSGELTYRLKDNSGRTLMTRSQVMDKGVHNIELNKSMANIANGNYILEVFYQGEVRSIKMIKVD